MSKNTKTSKQNILTSEEIAELRKKADDYFYKNDYSNAIKYYEEHVKYDKKNATSYEMLGWLYYSKNAEKSVKNYIKAFEYNYKNGYINYDAFGNLMLAITKYPDSCQAEIKFTIEYFIDKIRQKLLSQEEVFKHSKIPQIHRKLNIGYLSADLYNHAVMQFIYPILKSHNTNIFNVYFYYTDSCSDNITNSLKQEPYIFREINGKTFKETAEIIHNDKIDILIDLSSLTHKYSLSLLYKPAPIQMTYMGFLNTSGMKEVDYIISDKDTINKEEIKNYTEKPLYLPRYECFKFTNEIEHLLKESDLPYKKNGFITFGSFNCTSKINDRVLKCWAEILKRTPNSRLYIYRSQIDNDTKERIKKTLKRYKVDISRVAVDNLKYDFHFDAYKAVDIALDTFPFTGLTISIELTYMGVPFITRVCDSFASKGGLRINKALGYKELITYSDEEYIKAATDLANDIPRLEKYRKTTREKLKQSSICNYKQFTKFFERGLITAINKYYGLQ